VCFDDVWSCCWLPCLSQEHVASILKFDVAVFMLLQIHLLDGWVRTSTGNFPVVLFTLWHGLSVLRSSVTNLHKPLDEVADSSRHSTATAVLQHTNSEFNCSLVGVHCAEALT
jgi:hypothetical protein